MSDNKSNNTLFENSPFTIEKLSGRGGAFLVIPIDEGTVFSRETFSEDQKMFEQAALDFAQNKIKPQYKDLNKMNKYKFTEDITDNNYEKNSYIYGVLTSLREKINAPAKRKKVKD